MKKILLLLTLASSLMMAADGVALYKKCVACHGANAEKKALGKSQVINEFSKDQLVAAIKGYKDGTYGGVMKGLMKGQVADLNDEQTETLAVYITSLK